MTNAQNTQTQLITIDGNAIDGANYLEKYFRECGVVAPTLPTGKVAVVFHMPCTDGMLAAFLYGQMNADAFNVPYYRGKEEEVVSTLGEAQEYYDTVLFLDCQPWEGFEAPAGKQVVVCDHHPRNGFWDEAECGVIQEHFGVPGISTTAVVAHAMWDGMSPEHQAIVALVSDRDTFAKKHLETDAFATWARSVAPELVWSWLWKVFFTDPDLADAALAAAVAEGKDLTEEHLRKCQEVAASATPFSASELFALKGLGLSEEAKALLDGKTIKLAKPPGFGLASDSGAAMVAAGCDLAVLICGQSVSLRSDGKSVNCTTVSAMLGGGGHAAAAGFRIE